MTFEKAPKYLQRIAIACARKDTYLSQETAMQILWSLRKALLTGKLYLKVLSVSRSGMSRVLEIAYIERGEFVRVDSASILSLAGISPAGRITGCGMDMCFAAQYDLFQALCPHFKYQTRMPRYCDF